MVEEMTTSAHTRTWFADVIQRNHERFRLCSWSSLSCSSAPPQNVMDDFVCALKKRILLQGRMYVFEHYVCFHSNVLGYVKNKIIPLKVLAPAIARGTRGLLNMTVLGLPCGSNTIIKGLQLQPLQLCSNHMCIASPWALAVAPAVTNTSTSGMPIVNHASSIMLHGISQSRMAGAHSRSATALASRCMSCQNTSIHAWLTAGWVGLRKCAPPVCPQEVTAVRKRKNVGFPNSIEITWGSDGKREFFTSFLSRCSASL